MQKQDKLTDRQLSDEQSREIAETIREELARRRISRQTLAEQAKLSLSTLEKVLGGRRPFTLATTVRLEEALGVSLRKGIEAAPAPAVNGDVSPDGLGAYSRRSVAWLEGVYITLRLDRRHLDHPGQGKPDLCAGPAAAERPLQR